MTDSERADEHSVLPSRAWTMRYEFYDPEGKLLGLRENPDGKAMRNDEQITVHFVGKTALQWKIMRVSLVVSGLQTVVVRPIDPDADK